MYIYVFNNTTTNNNNKDEIDNKDDIDNKAERDGEGLPAGLARGQVTIDRRDSIIYA